MNIIPRDPAQTESLSILQAGSQDWSDKRKKWQKFPKGFTVDIEFSKDERP
jgi:hypothetical protein